MVPGPRRRPDALGSRLRERRHSRGLSRRIVAGLVGRSEEWLRQVETGARRLDSVRVAINLSRVLQIEDMAGLLGLNHDPSVATPAYHPLADQLRSAILDYPSPHVSTAQPPCQLPAHVAGAELTELWRDWQFSANRYTRIAGSLPRLVATLREAAGPRSAATGSGSRSAETVELLVCAYHLSRSFLAQLGERRLASVVADRGLLLADWAGGPRCRLVAARSLAMFHLQAREDREAMALAASAARELGTAAPTEPDHAVLWGSLHTIVAKAAARQQEVLLVEESLGRTRQAAAAIGTDREFRHVWFGPSDVAITEVYIALVLGDVKRALRLANRITIADRFPASQRAAFYAGMAGAHVCRREDAAAVFALLQVEDACAEEIRHNRLVAQTLRSLLERGNGATRAEVHRLAGLASLPEAPTQFGAQQLGVTNVD